LPTKGNPENPAELPPKSINQRGGRIVGVAGRNMISTAGGIRNSANRALKQTLHKTFASKIPRVPGEEVGRLVK